MSKLLRDLQDEMYTLVTDSQDVSFICESVGLLPEERQGITGAVVWLIDGECEEVYLTESSRPYELSARYHIAEVFTWGRNSDIELPHDEAEDKDDD